MEAEILKYMNGDMDVSEKIKMIAWINSNNENHKRFNVLKAKYVAYKLKGLPNEIKTYKQYIFKKS